MSSFMQDLGGESEYLDLVDAEEYLATPTGDIERKKVLKGKGKQKP